MQTRTHHLTYAAGRVLATIVALGAVVLAVCGISASAQASTTAVDDLVLIVAAHANVPAVTGIPSETPVERAVTAAVEHGADLSVITLDGSPRVTYRATGYSVDAANPNARRNRVDAQINALGQAVRSVRATTGGDDLSAALGTAADQITADGARHAAVVVVDDGITDRGYPKLTEAGVATARPRDLVAFARSHDQLVSMPRGTSTWLVGLGYGTDAQPALTAAQRTAVTGIWRSFLVAGGSSVHVVPTPRTGAGPHTRYRTGVLRPARVVDFPVRRSGRTTVATLSGDVLFDTGSSTLRAGAAQPLATLLGIVREPVNRTRAIEVDGYTDRTPGAGVPNQQLSTLRAQQVKTWLVGHGVAASRITAVGKGETGPDPATASAGQLQAARKVVVTIGVG